MDKNMVNIDDLVRARLTGGEEKERPGAWLLMKDLLDKEMPVVAVVATGYKLRRTLSVAALLLFIGSASIGGYKLYNSNASASNNASTNEMISNATSNSSNGSGIGGGMAAVVAGEDNNDKIDNSTEVKTATSKNTVASNTTARSSHLSGTKKINKGIDSSDGQLVTTKNPTVVASNTATNESALSTTKTENFSSDNALKNNTKNHSNKTYASANKLPKTGVKAESVNNANKGQVTPKVVKNNVNKASAPSNPIAQNVVPPVYANAGGVSTPTTNSPVVKREPVDFRKSNPRYVDSANYTYIRETGRRGTRRTDTIDKGVMRMEGDQLASAGNANTEAQNSEVNPAASLPANENQSKSGKGSASRNGYSETTLWEKMVANAKPNFTDVSFHPGLMLGVSSTVGKYNMGGLQLGASGSLNLSERWGIFAELKYLYRFGNGKSLGNDYNAVNGGGKQVTGTTYYEWKVDSQQHAFNITSTSLLELPLAVRYSARKLNFFAGANLAYNFAVNVEERFGKTYTSNFYGSKEEVDDLQKKWRRENDPKLVTDDFSSRVSLGYMLGVGYQVTPLIGLDIRASQVFWDNAKVHSSGAYLVSKEMYRVPCFQFNMTYRLQSKRNGPMKAR